MRVHEGNQMQNRVRTVGTRKPKHRASGPVALGRAYGEWLLANGKKDVYLYPPIGHRSRVVRAALATLDVLNGLNPIRRLERDVTAGEVEYVRAELEKEGYRIHYWTQPELIEVINE